ncbi:MAG: hypothetical protein JG764_466 [Clostridiales bacterium]|jgi:hypothetical protein|nr:hypothetical protein [Clostridiales bacterium]
MTLSYDQASGKIMTYTENGEPLRIDTLQVILATLSSDEKLSEGLPRIVFIGDNTPLTDGHFWVKSVAQIKIVPAVSEWKLKLSGIEEAEIDRSTFESAATCPDTPHPGQKYELTDKKGNKVTYEGIPLWVLVSTVTRAGKKAGRKFIFQDK